MNALLLALVACSSDPAPPATSSAPAAAIVSSPVPGAVVFVDGARRGPVPVELAAAELPRAVEVRADLYAPATVQVQPGAELSVDLQPGCAQLLAYDGRFSTDPALAAAQVAELPPADLPLVRNEIFARYGRTFDTPRYADHFAAQPWYRPNPSYTDAVLTANDKANAELIRSFEGSQAERIVGVGEYLGADGGGLMFVDVRTVERIDPDAGMYDWDRETLRWAALGGWVVTWQGADAWNPEDPACRQATLWQLDHDTHRIVEQTPILSRRG